MAVISGYCRIDMEHPQNPSPFLGLLGPIFTIRGLGEDTMNPLRRYLCSPSGKGSQTWDTQPSAGQKVPLPPSKDSMFSDIRDDEGPFRQTKTQAPSFMNCPNIVCNLGDRVFLLGEVQQKRPSKQTSISCPDKSPDSYQQYGPSFLI